MKKAILAIAIVSVVFISCDRSSSPEGRMTMKIEVINKQLDSLKQQNKAILDSLGAIKKELAAKP